MNETNPCENYDFECETSLRKILHALENLFKEHYLLFQSTVEDQERIIDELWVICQRFLILTRGAFCVRPYPREPTDREERESTAEFYATKQCLEESNNKLTASLYTLKDKCGAFDRALARVDASVPSRIVEGDKNRQPIYYYIELFADVFKYFHEIQNKLNSLGRFLMVEDMESILEYQQLLKPDKVVNKYFEKSLHIYK